MAADFSGHVPPALIPLSPSRIKDLIILYQQSFLKLYQSVHITLSYSESIDINLSSRKLLSSLIPFNYFCFKLNNAISCFFRFDFKGIIDYIFYAKQTMTPLGLLGPLSQDWLQQNKVIGCPHPHVYSDHFPLLVELEMIPTITASMNGLIGHR